VGSDAEPLLGEPCPLQVLALADAADHSVGPDLDVGEADRRMTVGIVVGEAGVVDVVDAGRCRLDQEQGRQAVGAVDDVGHDDQHPGDVP
jgi:hypothetical protein